MLIPVSPSIGLPALAALVLGESAGLPIPGETALIVAGGLAAAGHLSLPAVIAVAAISAIIGDMIGYTIGRRGGRKLLLREGRFSAHRHAAVAKADKYFEKYGVVTVFFARFIPGVRVVGAIAAGTTQMRLRTFAIANALGCFTWATTVASVAYAVGPSGAVVMIVVGFSIAGIGIASAWWKARQTRKLEAETGVEITDPLEALANLATVAEREAEHLIGADSDRVHTARANGDATGPRATGTKMSAKSAASAKSPASAQAAPMALAACSNRLP